MARRGQRGSGSTRTAPRQQRGNDGIIPVLAKAVREVEAEAERGRIRPGSRTRFQVIALLVREERARVKADTEHGEAWKEEQLRRLDGVATILAKTSVRDPSLLALLAEDAVVSDSARDLMRDMLKAAGFEVPDVEEVEPETPGARRRRARSTWCRSPWSRASWPTRSWSPTSPRAAARPRTHRLSSWELLGPLFRSFEYGGKSSCMQLPEPPDQHGLHVRDGLDLMPHQAQVVAAAARGAPHLPARRRAGPRQDRPGTSRGRGGRRVPAARRGPQRGQGQLGP